MLQYAIRILAKSDKSHSAPRSLPILLVSIPKHITAISITLIALINILLLLILFAQISEKDINPNRQVKAKSPKHTEISKVTALLNIMPGVSRSEERRVGKECRSRWSP